MGKHVNYNKKANNLKILLVIVIIVFILCLVYTAKVYFDGKKPVNTISSNEQQNNVNIEENEEDNPKDEVVVEESPEVEEPENTPDSAQESGNEEHNDEVTSISDEDKAIELAKKQYGTTDGVYFRIEQTISNGVYEVSVRDAETTMEYAWYTIDVKNETVK